MAERIENYSIVDSTKNHPKIISPILIFYRLRVFYLNLAIAWSVAKPGDVNNKANPKKSQNSEKAGSLSFF